MREPAEDLRAIAFALERALEPAFRVQAFRKAAALVDQTPREELTGALQPAKALQMGFEVGGRLARIAVRKGQPVAEGQIVASLDTELADAQVMQAEAAVKAAEAQASIAADNASRQTELQRQGSVSDFQQKSSSSTAATAAAQLQAAKAQLAQARAARRKHDLRAPLRASAADDLLHAAIEEAVARKPRGHDFIIDRRHQRPALARHMSVTGG